MTRVSILLVVILALIGISGCANESEHLSLKTCGAYAVPGMFHSELKGSGMAYDVVEEDAYGRTLFTFSAEHHMTEKIEYALVICQKYDGSYVYFYEDVCYLLGTYSEEDLAELKVRNDWGVALNEDKMSRRSNKSTADSFIVTDGNLEYKEMQSAFRKKLRLSEDQRITWYLWDVDSSGKHLGYLTVEHTDFTESFILIVSLDYEISIFDSSWGEGEIIDAESLAEFKRENDWSYGF